MSVDICLLVEGTYPYTSGGVSSWLHEIITNLADFSFSIVHFGAQPDVDRTPAYPLPDNVVEMRELFIHDHVDKRPARSMHRRRRRTGHDWEALTRFHAALAARTPFQFSDLLARLCQSDEESIGVNDLVHSVEGWELLLARYSESAQDVPFPDFFWTFRFTHLPLFRVLECRLPPARLYHAVSVGYNAFAGALHKVRTGAPLVLTEHGMYMREREIEIAQADWIYDGRGCDMPNQSADFFHNWWIGIFRFLTEFAYAQANCITSITPANQHYQLRNGAAPEKLRLIPNGVDVQRFARLRRNGTASTGPFAVGFVGRVVPIKDVKTFIRAIHLACRQISDLLAYVVGPVDEDPEYFAECRELASTLGLDSVLHFNGPADVRRFYSVLDVLVLTSISEAQPLVILEANCAGIPVVTSNVGGCSALVVGNSDEDRAIGPSGILTASVSPEETAAAIVRLWAHPELRTTMGRAGRARVRRFYTEQRMYKNYRDLYLGHLPAAAASNT